MSEKALQAFVRFATKFFVDSGKLWKRDDAGAHKLVLRHDCRLEILRNCHDRAAHRGVFATGALISERFWWPFIGEIIKT
jgi:hypothetical protein